MNVKRQPFTDFSFHPSSAILESHVSRWLMVAAEYGCILWISRSVLIWQTPFKSIICNRCTSANIRSNHKRNSSICCDFCYSFGNSTKMSPKRLRLSALDCNYHTHKPSPAFRSRGIDAGDITCHYRSYRAQACSEKEQNRKDMKIQLQLWWNTVFNYYDGVGIGQTTYNQLINVLRN